MKYMSKIYTVNYARQCRNTAVIQAKTFDSEKNPFHLILNRKNNTVKIFSYINRYSNRLMYNTL